MVRWAFLILFFVGLVKGVNLMGLGVSVEEIFDGFLGKDGVRGMCERERECAIGEREREREVNCLFRIGLLGSGQMGRI